MNRPGHSMGVLKFRHLHLVSPSIIHVEEEEETRQFVITFCERKGLGSISTVLISLPGKRLSCRINLKRTEKELRNAKF